MAIDLTVAAIPAYFVTMGMEYVALDERAEGEEAPAGYSAPDTLASLSMGVGSLLVPLATHALVKKVVPGEGRFPKVLVRTALASVAATTVADRLARLDDGASDDGRPRRARRRIRRWAQAAAKVSGVTAVASGGLAITSSYAVKLSPERLWRLGHQRDLGQGPLAWLVAIAGWDFIYYWNHRMMHEVRALWALHVVHHSSERYNLSTALRQPVADSLAVWVPYGLMSLLGVRPYLVRQARAVNLLYQYWVHTEAIDRLHRWLEAVLSTPSHHRAHHGSNRQYIDRNHGSILIVWDRLFGTFEPEEERVVYGLTSNIETFNPLRIATHEYLDIGRDVTASTTWRDRLSFVLRGPGWAYERHRQMEAEREAEEAPPG